jgi:GT2 family glycosyltransferase
MSGYDLHKDVFAAFGQIVNDWGVQIKPRWIMPATETWLGDNSFLGNSPKILENDFGIRESNLSINKEMLQSLGGFLGMELFGSHSRAATELRYCLWRAKKMDIRIAYIPAAIAHHHIAVKSRTQMIQRAYWQGVSDGILEYIMYRGPWWNTGARAGLNMAAMIVLFGFALFYFVLFDQPKWIFYGMRATRRLGLILSELHLKGSFSRMRAWLAEQSS